MVLSGGSLISRALAEAARRLRWEVVWKIRLLP